MRRLSSIRNVSIWHGSAPNPWMRGLLENFSMIDGTWLELRKEGKLVGCGAVVRDNQFQLATALGLEDDVPGGYFYLLYAAMQEAFEHKVRLVRFGSGAYDVKRQAGLPSRRYKSRHGHDVDHHLACEKINTPPAMFIGLPQSAATLLSILFFYAMDFLLIRRL